MSGSNQCTVVSEIAAPLKKSLILFSMGGYFQNYGICYLSGQNIYLNVRTSNLIVICPDNFQR